MSNNIDDNKLYNKWWNSYTQMFVNDKISFEEKGELVTEICKKFEDINHNMHSEHPAISVLCDIISSQIEKDFRDWKKEKHDGSKGGNLGWVYRYFEQIFNKEPNNQMKELIKKWIDTGVSKEVLKYCFEQAG